MRSPGVKGLEFESVVADVRRLLQEGRLTGEELEVRLGADELELLDAKIVANDWYPMATHARLLGVLGEKQKDGEIAFFVEHGRQTAERLLSDKSEDDDHAAPLEELGAEVPGDWVGRTVLCMAARLYNIGRWTWLAPDAGAGEFAIEITEAEAIPEPLQHAIEGMLRLCLERAVGLTPDVGSARPSRDRIEYYFEAPAAAA